jgi:hypothetical protein
MVLGLGLGFGGCFPDGGDDCAAAASVVGSGSEPSKC